MAYMNASIARSVAESRWGSGGTSSTRTNRKKVYYFSCSSHGGYILPASALSQEEYENVAQYVEPYKADVYRSFETNKVVYMHPFRTKGSKRLYGPISHTHEEFFLFEEDCDWAVLEMFTDIRRKNCDDPRAIEITFWNWFDRTNPVVQNRKEVAQKRQNRDPDLIISALNHGGGIVRVTTADGSDHFVTEYNRDEYGFPICHCANWQIKN